MAPRATQAYSFARSEGFGVVFRIRPGAVEWREVEGEVVAVDLRDHMYLAVNRTGAALWPALSAGADREALVDCLVNRFDVTREVAGADVDTFLTELNARELLETVDSSVE